MPRVLYFLAVMAGSVFAFGIGSAAAAEPELVVDKLKNPESVVIGADGLLYATVIGEFDRDGDGGVVIVDPGGAEFFTQGLNDPKGIAAFQEFLFVADKNRVMKIDARGNAAVLADADAFPRPPLFLNDVVVDSQGVVYVSDSGDFQAGTGGAVFRVAADGAVTTVIDSATSPAVKGPNGLWLDDDKTLLVLDFASGELNKVDVATGNIVRLCGMYPGGDGLARDARGKYYIGQWSGALVSVLGKESRAPRTVTAALANPADFCLSPDGNVLFVPDMLAGTISSIDLTQLPAAQVDESPAPVAAVRAFPRLTFNRPIVLTHAGDGSDRVFVASQLGTIRVFPNKQDVRTPKLFLDIEEKVDYADNENEEGLLGLAFHPKYKENGEFFVKYSLRDPAHTTVVSRFRVSSDDPNKADPASEEEVLRIAHPYWNHKGGTLAFGPDGYLYIVVGDGGSGNDPYGNGQNLRTLLGSVLRIDVDRRDEGKAYAVPADNPFVDYPEAQPEIWAYGVRNVWRLAFDRETGACWAADVGQDIWEEINILTAGGNYGWNLREGRHPFGIGGVQQPREDLIEPIYEYHHDVGKSITGGFVYRGKKLPELTGAYLYADYVTGQPWALWYDAQRGEVTANRPIAGNVNPVMSFGEDEQGEVYYMTTQGWLHGFEAAESGGE